ncbi:glycosyltransferase family 9 protein [Candidatus Omnitrophota bacterium]
MAKIHHVKHIGNLIAGIFSFFIKSPSQKNKISSIKKILIIKIWGVGNIVLLIPILKKIREQHKNSEIYFLTLDSNKGLLENTPYITKVIYLRFTTNIFRICYDFFRSLSCIRKLNIDLLLNFEQCNRISAIFSSLTKAKTSIGFELPGYVSLYTNTVKNNPCLHVSKNFVNLANAGGISIDKYEYIPFATKASSKKNVEEILKERSINNTTIVALHIGSGLNFTGKRWNNINFARLADELIQRYSVAIAYTGTENERKLIEDTLSIMKHKASNLCGKFTLDELVEFLSRCHIFISNDTGPLHIAISLRINTVGLYGPMNPAQYGSLNKNSLSFYKPTGCSPCLTDLNNKTSFCNDRKCLDSITPEEILKEISDRFF